MPTTDTLSRLESDLLDQFQQTATRHREGAPSPQVVSSLTDLADEIVKRAAVLSFEEIGLQPSDDSSSCPLVIVALGGYGRRELNPYSDIDVMVLTTPRERDTVAGPTKRFFQHLWDLRYRLGHSLRTVADCLELANVDLTVQTALLESRYLAGNRSLFEECRTRLRSTIRGRRLQTFLRAKREERQREGGRYGETTALLEPNVKRSPGGLRDLHAIKWAALAMFGRLDWYALSQNELLIAAEADQLHRHQSLLWQIRNDLHFHAGRVSDVLSFDEQQRLARVFGYHDERHLLAVEKFMQCYYRATTEIREICDRLFERIIATRRFPRLASALFTRHVGHYLLMDEVIDIRPGALQTVATSPAAVMEMVYLAHLHGLKFSDGARKAACAATEHFPSEVWQATDVGRMFFVILRTPGHTSRGGRIAETLHVMHQVKLLGRLLPAFTHVTSLMQFNRYHHYTVDEHCIRAVGQAEQFLAKEDRIGTIYRQVKRKELLHLALLLHDVGKGYEGDHSERGVELADRAADWLALTTDDRQLLSFLIRHHLLMSHIAFRRDLNDEKVLLRFARQAAQPEALTLLYLLTIADIQAVGPETWTSWKSELLKELFDKSMEILAGTRAVGAEEERINTARSAALSYAEQFFDRLWLDQQCAVMPNRYWMTTRPEQVVEHLAGFKQLRPNDVVIGARAQPERGTFLYTIYTYDDLIPGIFSKIAGVLAAKGLQILAAQVYTRLDGTIVDTFEVHDPDYTGQPPPRRIEAVSTAIRQILKGQTTIETLFDRSRRVDSRSRGLTRHPVQIEVDNDSSDDATIVDIFADDSQGLLFVITQALFEAGLSIISAKISTRLDQIADVFYVKTSDGGKLTDPTLLAQVKAHLRDAITAHLEPPD